MIFDTPRNDGVAATGPGTGAFDVLRTAFERPIYAGNPAAESNALEKAYDDRIDAIFAATGQRLENPSRMLAPRREAEPGESGLFPRLARRPIDAARDPHAEFEASLAKLAEQFPDQRQAIRPERSVREDARELARKAEASAADAYERYDGPAGLGGLASLAGGFAGAMWDPTTLPAMMLAPQAGVGRGLSPLLWSALKQGAANAGVEAAFQPQVAKWRKEAGLGYEAGDFIENVGMAFVLGGALDFGGRAAVRAIQGRRGLVPQLDGDGRIDGWQTPEQAAAAADLARKVDLVGRASQGDLDAIRTLANEQGVGTTPELRSVLRQMEDEAATSPRRPGFDPDESDAAFMQALRHVMDDELEPPPGRVDPLPKKEAPIVQFRRDAAAIEAELPAVADGYSRLWRGNRPGEIGSNPSFTNDLAGIALPFRKMYDGKLSYVDVPARELSAYEARAGAAQGAEFLLPEAYYRRATEVTRIAADPPQIQRVVDGDGSVIDAAVALRQRPDLAAGTSLASELMQVARALARLSDEAFAAVLEGRIDPAHAALVGRHVDDPLKHAGMIETLAAARPESLQSARRMIAEMREPPQVGRRDLYLGGLDDPHGAEAKAHTEALEQALAERVMRAERRLDTARGEPDPLDVALRTGLAEADALERMSEIIELCKVA